MLLPGFTPMPKLITNTVTRLTAEKGSKQWPCYNGKMILALATTKPLAIPAIPECLYSTRVEAPANPELHWCCKGPFQQFVQWEAEQVDLEQRFAARHHWQHHG